MSWNFHSHQQSVAAQAPVPYTGTRQQANTRPFAAGESKTDHGASSKQMEVKGFLSRLELTATQAQGKAQDQNQAQPQSKKWTVAILLSANQTDHADRTEIWNGDRQLRELQKLAKKTDGQLVNFMVHADHVCGSKEKPCHQAYADYDGACLAGAAETERAITERYFIHDGKIDRLADAKYRDATEDIKALMHDAGKLAPSARLGLVVQSHAAGSQGITTNIGPFLLIKQLMSSRPA